MKRSIKLVGVVAVFLALAACSEDKEDNNEPSSSSGGGNDGHGACFVDMGTLSGGVLDYQTCNAPYDKASCEIPSLGGEFRASCPANPACDFG